MEKKMDPKKTEKEKMTEEQRRRRIDIERELGVPDPPVPNRAHTELSAKDYQISDSRALNIDENALHEYAEKYKNHMRDSRRRPEIE